MSDNQVQFKGRRLSRGKLPTPPPDPAPTVHDPEDALVSTRAQEFINSLQRTMFTSVIATEDAFDHLDKLYKLMEQMLDIRQQNARLLTRIRDLEHLKNLEAMHHQLGTSGTVEDAGDDTGLAESLLESMLSETKKDYKNKPRARSRLTQSILKRQITGSDDDPMARKLSIASARTKPSKVSKWTKVKAAFRWEKASSSVTGAKSQDSGISGMTPINYEVARYLRVPSSDEAGNSPADSGAADGSTPGSLSSASSNDDVHHQDLRRDSQVTDEDRRPFILEKDAHHRRCSGIAKGNAHKYPHYHDSARSDEERIDLSDKENCISQRSSTKSNKRQNPSTKKGVPVDLVKRYQKVIADEDVCKNTNRKRISKWVRVKKAFLNPTVLEDHTRVDPKDLNLYKNDERNVLEEEIQNNYKQLQKKLSLEFKTKLVKWDKIKACSSTASSSTIDEARDPAFVKKMEEWEKIKTQPCKQPQANIVREEDLAPDFKKKLEEWQKIKGCSIKDDLLQSKARKKLGDWPRWKSVTGNKEEQGHDNPPLSDDFLKKLDEWRKMKEPNKHFETSDGASSPGPSRKQLQTNLTPALNPTQQQDLQWFDVALDKIEIERKRLEAERQKFLQREERLAKLRRTVLGSENKKDVLVHTPSGFHRFEGISRKFTQKLCEWETSQGIGPESSTFALLTSHYTPHIFISDDNSQAQAKRLHRSKSAESFYVLNVNEAFPASHHPSSLSLNDIDELERECLALSSNSSYQSMGQSMENVDNDEPEAVIVEVEDVVEETAALLEEYLEEKHFPIYQRESTLNTCEQQHIIPHIKEATDSTNHQYCGYLLDDILRLSHRLKNREPKMTALTNGTLKTDNSENGEDNHRCDLYSNGEELSQQKDETNIHTLLDMLLTKLTHLQDVHSRNVTNLNITEEQPTSSHFSDLMDSAQDLFGQLSQMIEQLQDKLQHHNNHSSTSGHLDFVFEKVTELKRTLSYFYAESDLTAPRRKGHNSLTTLNDFKEQDEKDKMQVDPAIVEKLVISTSTNYLTQENPNISKEPTSVFVNTTRRLFIPFDEADSARNEGTPPSRTFLPPSPASQRKQTKEISPAIRAMLAKYNQMVSEQDSAKLPSSGSASPTAWRSPVAERRIKARRERYMEELSKVEIKREVSKSASTAVLSLITNKTPQVVERKRSILRSTSASVIHNHKLLPPFHIETGVQARQASEDRFNKAKEEFMGLPQASPLPPEPCSAPPTCSKKITFPARNRYSQVSTCSDSSYDSNTCDGALIKSASAGMINVDETTYQQIDHGYLSLPRAAVKQKSGGLLGGLTNLASKFRKVKMKRKKNMKAVSALCRQSLVVELNPGSQENVAIEQQYRHDSLTVPTPSSSEDTSPSSSRSGSWIRRSRIFKAL